MAGLSSNALKLCYYKRLQLTKKHTNYTESAKKGQPKNIILLFAEIKRIIQFWPFSDSSVCIHIQYNCNDDSIDNNVLLQGHTKNDIACFLSEITPS